MQFFSALVYLNFVQTAVREEAGGLICHPDKNFGCALGDRVLSWLITALFFG